MDKDSSNSPEPTHALTGIEDSDQQKKLLRTLSTKELPNILNTLIEQSEIKDPEFSSYLHEDAFLNTLSEWGVRDFNSAFSWTKQLKDNEDRAFCSYELIIAVTQRDYPAGIALASEHLLDEQGVLQGTPEFMTLAAHHSEQSLVKLCLLCSSFSSGNSSGADISFPEFFKFSTAINQLIAHQDELPKGQKLNYLPTNFLSEWAKRSPEKAFEWLQQGDFLEFNDQISDFLKGYCQSATSLEISKFLIAQFSKNADNSFKYQVLSCLIEWDADPFIFRNFVESFKDRKVVISHLTRVLIDSHGYRGSGTDAFLKKTLGLFTPEERLLFLANTEIPPDLKCSYQTVFHSLGFHEHEIQIYLPEETDNKQL